MGDFIFPPSTLFSPRERDQGFSTRGLRRVTRGFKPRYLHCEYNAFAHFDEERRRCYIRYVHGERRSGFAWRKNNKGNPTRPACSCLSTNLNLRPALNALKGSDKRCAKNVSRVSLEPPCCCTFSHCAKLWIAPPAVSPLNSIFFFFLECPPKKTNAPAGIANARA